MRAAASLLLLLALPLLSGEIVDLTIVDRIKTEALERSQVMDTLFNLTDVHGPRLTASPEFEEAAQWTVDRLKGYGLENVHTETWGPFGRSWSLRQASLELIEPHYAVLNAVPLAWSASTNGAVSADLVIAPHHLTFRSDPKKWASGLKDFEQQWHGKLRGKMVLLATPKPPKDQSKPQFRRYTDAELAELANASEPNAKIAPQKLEDVKWPEDPEEAREYLQSLPDAFVDELYERYQQVVADRGKFFADEGVVAVLTEDSRAHEGLLFAESAGSYKAAASMAPATFVITAEQYDRIARMVEKNLPVKVRASLKAEASKTDSDGKNIIGEIPGTGENKDEIVMVGAHFDSWHTGVGATDNGAGSAVMIETVRILKALHLKLNRTVRIGLWSGEEQGLYGSAAYVKQHFADPKVMQLSPEHAKLSGYFNLDNGSGKIRGVYLQSNDAMRPIFKEWLAPFADMGVSTITNRDTGGTDHLSFVAVGLPGFQFIQDPLDYSTITHHSSMDTYDHAIPADLMQASAVIASVVYDAANRKEMLPRRDLPAATK
jgi:carboxypeptidase Q